MYVCQIIERKKFCFFSLSTCQGFMYMCVCNFYKSRAGAKALYNIYIHSYMYVYGYTAYI